MITAQRNRLKQMVMYCATVFGPVHNSEILNHCALYERWTSAKEIEKMYILKLWYINNLTGWPEVIK